MVPAQTQVHNRIYVMRDYNIANLKVGGTLSYPASIKDANLYDATANSLQTATGATLATEIAAIKSSKGWYIDLSNSGSWVGEKSLAQPTIYAGTLFVSTFTPASASTATVTCSADEGLAKLYGLNILNGGASADWDYDGDIDTADRSINVGGGIPPETVIIVRSQGNSGLVGVTNVPKLAQNPGRSKSGWFGK
jgi:type IV pilus assembly protein PilY1